MTRQFAGAVLFNRRDSAIQDEINSSVSNVAFDGRPRRNIRVLVGPNVIMAWRPALDCRSTELDGEVRQSIGARDRFVVVGSLFLDNRAELVSELGLSEESSEIEIVQELALRFGVESLGQRLIGNFAFAVWNCADSTLTCYTDRIGLRPFYYAALDDRFIFSWSPVPLSLHPKLKPRLNLNYLSDYLRDQTLRWREPQTAFESIFRLRPGYRIQVLGTTIRESPYWDPTKIGRLTYKDSREYTDHFRSLLKTVVRSKL